MWCLLTLLLSQHSKALLLNALKFLNLFQFFKMIVLFCRGSFMYNWHYYSWINGLTVILVKYFSNSELNIVHVWLTGTNASSRVHIWCDVESIAISNSTFYDVTSLFFNATKQSPTRAAYGVLIPWLCRLWFVNRLHLVFKLYYVLHKFKVVYQGIKLCHGCRVLAILYTPYIVRLL